MTFTIQKRYLFAAVAIIIATMALALTSCTHGVQAPSGQASENAQQRADTNSMEQSQPIPHFNWSQIRQTAIDAETIQANSTQTTSFFFQMGNQDPVFSCPSIGEPVSNTAQLSNPDQVVHDSYPNGGAALTIGQQDPNGVYAPSTSSGTYVICVDAHGAKYLQYWEGDVMTVTAAAQWDQATHSVKVVGAPTAAVHTAPGK